MAQTGETSGPCHRPALGSLERQLEEHGAALRECEDRLRDIAELSGEWAWETDREHRFVEIFGDSAPLAAVRKGIVGRTRWEVAGADPQTDPDWGRHKADLDARRPFRRFRYAVDTAEGGRMLILSSGKPLFDAQGNFAGYRGTARDETAQAEAWERREAAERLLREAIEGIAGGIAIWDGEERLVLCNETYRRMYPDSAPWIVRGIRFEDALRQGLARGHYPEAVDGEEEWIAGRLRAQRSLEDASELQLSDGRWVLSTKRRMPNGWTAALRIDITALKQTQMALRESRDSLERAQRVAHIGSMSRSLATDEAVWSEEAFRIFGVEPESFEPTTDNMLRLVHPDDRAIIHELQARGRQGLDPGSFECRILRPDGRERLIRGEGLMMRDVRGKPLWVTATVQDVTEARVAQQRERELEQQLAQSQKMEAIGNLTGGMAHDFNNLLGVVIGNLDLVRERLVGDPETAQIVDEALEAAWRGSDLTRRLLAFARRQPLRPATIDVNALVGNTVRLLQRLLGEDIEIGLGLAENIWPVVADPAQLEASLANLATNARDAMPGGGRLSISTRNRVLDADYAARNADVTPGEYVLIEVSDTGAGMSQETIKRIFEPFFTTKEPGKGTGLGLSMVFGFLKQSKGHVSVYSEAGVGTAFRLYLPRAHPEAAPQAAAPRRTAERGAGERVLVVEDDLAVRRVVVRQLGDLGYGVAAVDRAAAALELLERERFDLLFTDIVMPGGLDGVELARLAAERWPALKVLLTSGFPDVRAGNTRSLADGPRLLSKPYSRDELAHALRVALEASGDGGRE